MPTRYLRSPDGGFVPYSGGGTDTSLGITGAAVGQIPQVSAVDESGVPTAWEAADLPSGGGGSGEYEYIGEFTVGEDVTEWIISEDNEGKPIELREIYFEYTLQPAAGTTSNTDLLFGNPAYSKPFATNAPFLKKQALKTTSVNIARGNGIHAIYYPSGTGSTILCFMHKSSYLAEWSIGRETTDFNAEKKCIAGLAMQSADATTGQIGAGSTVRIWGVRV